MKKVLLFMLITVFICAVSFADPNPSDIRAEKILNNCYDSTSGAIKAKINGGNATISALTVDTKLVIPSGNDPDVGTIGQLSWDSNGQWLRTYDYTYGQVAVGTMNKSFTIAVEDPENAPTHAVRSTRSKLVWQNTTGMTFRLTSIYGVSDTTGYYFKLYKSNTSSDVDVYNQVTMDVISCDNPLPAGGYYKNITSGFDSSTLETGKWLIWEHGGSSAEELSVVVNGVLSADVN